MSTIVIRTFHTVPVVAGKNENEEKRELIFREDGQGVCN